MDAPSIHRFEAVQVVRAIAAMLVVLVHAINANDYRVDLPRSWLGSSSAGYFNNFGACGVDMFFVLSGFVMAHAIGSIGAISGGKFAIDRFTRVVPYYWLATAVFLIAMTSTGRDFTTTQGFTSLTILPLYNPAVFEQPILLVGWTLAFEMAFYGLVALVILFEPDRVRRRPIANMAVCFLGFASYFFGTPELDLLAALFNPIWLEFALGLTSYALWQRFPNVSPRGSFAILCAAMAGFTISPVFGFPFNDFPAAILNENSGIKRTIWWGMPSTALLLGLIWLTRSSAGGWLTKRSGWRLLRKIGDASYSLYLLHLGVIFLYEDLAPTSEIDADLAIAGTLAVCVALALAAHRWIERPLINWLRGTSPAKRMLNAASAT